MDAPFHAASCKECNLATAQPVAYVADLVDLM